MRNPRNYKRIRYTIRTLQTMCALIALLGFFVFFGAVGSYDNAVITFGKLIFYMATGLSFGVGGVLGFHYFRELDEE